MTSPRSAPALLDDPAFRAKFVADIDQLFPLDHDRAGDYQQRSVAAMVGAASMLAFVALAVPEHSNDQMVIAPQPVELPHLVRSLSAAFTALAQATSVVEERFAALLPSPNDHSDPAAAQQQRVAVRTVRTCLRTAGAAATEGFQLLNSNRLGLALDVLREQDDR